MKSLSRSDLSLALSILAGVGLALAAAGLWLPVPGAADWLVGAGLVIVYLAGGLPAAWRALGELWQRRVLDIDLLMVVAAIAAAAVGAPFEGAVLLVLFSAAGALEERALGRARRAIEALMSLRPETALRRSDDGGVQEIPAADLVPGDVVILRPGARVPADGTVKRGSGGIDEANITGESMPVSKAPGEAVFEGTVNLDGVLEITVARAMSDSTIARMIRLVTEAQAARAPSERFSDWFGQRYTIAVMLGAVLAFAGFCWAGHDWHGALYKAATLLVAASPCAIVISVPAAILSALSAAARGGVLFKGGGALETLAMVETFAFDKTGTLTTGRARITGIASLDGDEAGFLALLGGIEAQSEHHIAAAIRREIEERGLQPVPVGGVTAFPGKGLTGRDGIGALWAGNASFARDMGAPGDDARFRPLTETKGTVVFLGRGARILGAVSLADEPRGSAVAALAALRQSGVRRIVMMTGDRRAVALRIGAALGFDAQAIHADMLPQDKVDAVAVLGAQGRVAFVGGGAGPLPSPRAVHGALHSPESRARDRCHGGAGHRRVVLRPAAAPCGDRPRRRYRAGGAERAAPAARSDPGAGPRRPGTAATCARSARAARPAVCGAARLGRCAGRTDRLHGLGSMSARDSGQSRATSLPQVRGSSSRVRQRRTSAIRSPRHVTLSLSAVMSGLALRIPSSTTEAGRRTGLRSWSKTGGSAIASWAARERAKYSAADKPLQLPCLRH